MSEYYDVQDEHTPRTVGKIYLLDSGRNRYLFDILKICFCSIKKWVKPPGRTERILSVVVF